MLFVFLRITECNAHDIAIGAHNYANFLGAHDIISFVPYECTPWLLDQHGEFFWCVHDCGRWPFGNRKLIRCQCESNSIQYIMLTDAFTYNEPSHYINNIRSIAYVRSGPNVVLWVESLLYCVYVWAK